LVFISDYHAEHGWAPSLDDCVSHTGASKSTVWHDLEKLVEDGFLLRGVGTPRAMAITQKGKREITKLIELGATS
jgi:SOS-response transcriptional repressor LexA